MEASPIAAFRPASLAAARRSLRSLQDRFSTSRELRPPERAVYYDTFDWRLHRRGTALVARPAGDGRVLSWITAGEEVLRRVRLPAVPAFAEDFPEGAFRDALAPILEMRRLLPVVEVEYRLHSVRVLDEQQKTVARVELEEGTARPVGDRAARRAALPPRLVVRPVRGYPAAHGEAVRALRADGSLRAADAGRLELALSTIGVEPGTYAPKPRVALAADEPADLAIRRILRALLDVVRVNERGVIEDLDTEFLHDFRVAVRRTRTCLGQFKDVLPAEALARFRDEFAWLGRLTGPVRDLDVYRLQMPGYRAGLPVETRAHLDPLERFLREHKREEQRALAAALADGRYRRLIAGWSEFLDAERSPGGVGPAGDRPIFEVAAARLRKRFRRALQRGRDIGAETPAAALHCLRIDAKKLRYLLEFFYSLLPADDLAALVGELKRLQDNLGSFNDLQVQQDTLAVYAHRMHEEGTATPDSLLAMGRLIERLAARQRRERRRFARRFRRFASRESRARFRRVVSAGPRAKHDAEEGAAP